uniref:uncharacterized protein LOC122589870 n=1 Tax=Erigeron canadensis TaxID=72917 RepID=UPI001CB99174|nr:uncharacterized protein LOC122589870 [Erigeron canadensis]
MSMIGLLKEIAGVRPEPVTYLNENYNKIWSRGKFGTTSKCDYITNNIAESFNSWLGALRYKLVLDLLDGIRDKLMRRFDKKRNIVEKWKGSLVPKANMYLNGISKNLGAYGVFRSSDNRAEVEYKGKRWEVILNERKCTFRVWQVTGLPCVHAAAFIAFTRDTDWVKYVDSCFTITNFIEAYALEIAPLPGKDQWVERETSERIYPPILKRPPGRPRKDRIKPPGEAKRKKKCPRCGGYGHHEKKCKNPTSQVPDPNQSSTSKRRRGKNTKARESCAI